MPRSIVPSKLKPKKHGACDVQCMSRIIINPNPSNPILKNNQNFRPYGKNWPNFTWTLQLPQSWLFKENSLVLRLHALYLNSCKTLLVKLKQVPQELWRSVIPQSLSSSGILHDFRSSATSKDLRSSAISQDFRSCTISKDLRSSVISQHLRSSSAISQDLCNLAKVDFVQTARLFIEGLYLNSPKTLIWAKSTQFHSNFAERPKRTFRKIVLFYVSTAIPILWKPCWSNLITGVFKQLR